MSQDQQQTLTCTNCGASYAPNHLRCPECGLARPIQPTQGVTTRPWLDTVLGAFSSLALTATGVGVIAVFVLYYTMKERYAHFANGLRIGCLGVGILIILLFLGVLLLCLGAIRT